MLSKEQNFFLTVLSDHLNGRKTIVPDVLDKKMLFSISRQQQCEGIVYYQTHLPEFQSAMVSSTFHYVNRNDAINKIHDLFCNSQIEYFIFKGSEIAQYYPVPQLRTMGDTDILVHEEDRERAHRLLLDLGMINHSKGKNEWVYFYKGMEFELHCRLMNEKWLGIIPPHFDFMNCRWEYTKKDVDSTKFHLDTSYHFVFILLHLRKHFINSGVGFRQFVDIAVMQLKCNLNWNWIEAKLTELYILDFAKTCFALIERWFEIDFPISANLDDKFYAEATETIIANGVFGFDNDDNRANYVILQLKRDRTYKIKNALSVAFPSYEILRRMSDYKFINGKPWLLPITWLYRFISKIFSPKAKSAISSIKTPFTVDDSSINARIDTLRKWGINDI